MAVLFFNNTYYPKAKRGSDFDQEFPYQQERGVAFQNGDSFFAISLNNGGDPHFFQIPSNSSITLKEWVSKSFGDANPTESAYLPGTFYKRIWRPGGPGYGKTTSQEKLTQSFVSLRILLNKLEELFETIEPAQSNLSAYGHRIREVILLACMEVESSFAAVLKENNYPSNGRLTTNDFVKACSPMLLDGYELSLQQYPEFPSFKPFKDWNTKQPTESLIWYDAYNKTKHDREENLKLGSLNNAVVSVGAAVVMFHAQYGMYFGPPSHDHKSPFIRSIFKVTTVGFDSYAKDCYIPKLVLPLGSAFPEWTSINYPF
jgi:hypothetical protein